MENYKFLHLKKQKAEAVAKLFARWIKYEGKEVGVLNEKEPQDYYEDLNKMSLEMTLWIEDDALLTDIMLRLQNHDSAKDIRAIVGTLRKTMLGRQTGTFDSRQITLWPR